MTLHTHEIKRLYFSLKEVATALRVAPSALRFYGVAFGLGFGNSDKGSKRIRLSVKQVGELAIIVRLREHLSVESARKMFNSGRAERVLALLENVDVAKEQAKAEKWQIRADRAEREAARLQQTINVLAPVV